MAGSLNHIIDDETGQFTMSGIENLGDAHEALDECFKIILHLSGGDMRKVSEACERFNLPDPWSNEFGDALKVPMRFGGPDAQ